ncbi:uncharacterized protein isoform X4 [Rhodnius prolixus]|uniref:uncharacterized protein isoform X4 n=1 Tax=Rhodnius prolixus TaxID=13249 RepID=UPI003D187793
MSSFNSARLKSDIKADKIARDALRDDNKKLEAEQKKLEKELNRLSKEDPSSRFIFYEKVQHLECEAYQKYLQQLKEKETLKKQVATLKERLRILIEAKTDITEMNVEALSQAEIIRTVKQLERRKVDAQSKLHEAENSLNSTAKDIHVLKFILNNYLSTCRK